MNSKAVFFTAMVMFSSSAVAHTDYERFRDLSIKCRKTDVFASIFFAVKAQKELPGKSDELWPLINQGVFNDMVAVSNAAYAPLQGTYYYFILGEKGISKQTSEYRLADGSEEALRNRKQLQKNTTCLSKLKAVRAKLSFD
ncbi:hypothetical protein EGM51_04555 [Verrucomicrobia bacterium S94]|nr:hypothetical protein EGM51_04555 [Verrucomicrobia bacterium S94]